MVPHTLVTPVIECDSYTVYNNLYLQAMNRLVNNRRRQSARYLCDQRKEEKKRCNQKSQQILLLRLVIFRVTVTLIICDYAENYIIKRVSFKQGIHKK